MMYAKTARVRTSRTWLFAASLVAPASMVCIPSAWLAFTWAFATMFAFMLAWMLLPKTRRGLVRADAHGLWLGERLVARRARIHSVCVVTSCGASWLRMSTTRGVVDAEVAGAADERELLAALRLDEHGIVARYTAAPDRSRSRASLLRFALSMPVPLAILGAALALTRLSPWPWSLVGLALVCATLLVQLRASLRNFESVSVGADGVRRRSPAGRARFTPFSRVASITIDRGDLVLRLTDGSEIAWHGGWNEPVPILAAMADRIQRGLQAHRALASSRVASQLARGSRSLDRWIREVRAATDPDSGTYRVAAIPPEELWETVESAAAPPAARAGAAVALRRVLDDAGRKRLLDASATCASTSLRHALESIASDDPIEQPLALVRD